MSFACKPDPAHYSSYEEYPVYDGRDLGFSYTSEQTLFKVWSPPAAAVRLHLYEKGDGGSPLRTIEMNRAEQGVWEARVMGDLEGRYYTFQVYMADKWLEEVPDPYARATGVNGRRAMVVDLNDTNPAGWANDRRPPLEHFNDIIIYELHVRDASIHPESGITHKGKYLGLTETGTREPEGQSTGLDHITELGVTHVHLLPVFDFRSVDETQNGEHNYNWGYDPQNYNVPEGSYSTNPYDGRVRIREFKQMVKAFHDQGIRVIMDVVYNHTGETEGSNFNQLVPGYYYRHRAEGLFSDAAACGNETASERPMMRKFMLESVEYWVEEYHVDGFRFDLMGIHDIETMNLLSRALHEIDPTIFIYGEGWTAGESPLPESKRALKKNTAQLDRIAAFSDDIRDAIKGHVFTHDDKGFASGKPGLEQSIRFGIAAAVRHPQVHYDSVQYSKAPWSPAPSQTITYASCHDNHTLWDRLSISCPEANQAEKIRMHKLAGTLVLTAQGVAFLHAGTELLRTKQGVENSYKSSDTINRIDWSRKAEFPEVGKYYRDLIRLRKAHPAFRMRRAPDIRDHLSFLETGTDNLVAYTIDGKAVGDRWPRILVLLNGNRGSRTVDIPEGRWTVILDGEKLEERGLGMIDIRELTVPASSAMILVDQTESEAK